MESKKNIQAEIKDISPIISGLDNALLYQVSENYFTDFSTILIEKIKAGAEPVYHFPISNPFTIPSNYFENLSENILQKIKSTSSAGENIFDELEEIAPLLNTISKQPVYQVPQGYFGSTILAKKKTAQPFGKVISIKISRVFKITAAAVSTGIVGIGLFLLADNNHIAPLQANGNKPKTEVRNLTDDDIVEFLSNSAATEDLSASAAIGGTGNVEMKNAVHEISDEEIQQFLQDSDLREGI